MNIDIKKLNPWNWFEHEGNGGANTLTVQRDASGSVNNGLPNLFAADSLRHMHSEVDRLFDSVFSHFGTGLPHIFGSPKGSSTLYPSVDIKETKNDYKITVEVPGVEENDLKLELSGSALTIRGEKKHETAEEGENYYCVERSYGSFCRTLSLPEDAHEDGIDAKFRNGVLTITVPRKQIAKPKQESKVIDIKRAAA